jgi:hypothetical protein
MFCRRVLEGCFTKKAILSEGPSRCRGSVPTPTLHPAFFYWWGFLELNDRLSNVDVHRFTGTLFLKCICLTHLLLKHAMNSGFRYQDPLETWSAKFSRKFKENPWVPLGAFWSLLSPTQCIYNLSYRLSRYMRRSCHVRSEDAGW